MKSKLLISFVLLFSVFVSDAQRKCGTMDNHQRLLATDPNYQKNRDAIEQFTTSYVATHAANSSSRAVISIPVVVHVVYNTTTQNISDAQIQSQISILNQDFAATNADKSGTPSAFVGLVANTNVQFCLAQQTPAGGASTGIVRKSTTTTSFIDDDKVKYAAQGGDDAWDATKYLNIWVCNLGGGLLGYAQFPGGAVATDGVVINYTAFGNTGTAASPYNKGRTATHEIGHWLNLRHIWGDANCGSDLVNDTPTQQTSNYGCPTYPHITCSNAGDMSMNYMDYTDDACMYMFTSGQSTRMNALFASGGSRVGLVSSLGCSAPTTPGTCATPTGLTSTSVTASSATLNWTAVSGASSYTVGLKTSTATTYTTYSATTNSIGFSGLAASTTYNFTVTTNCASGASGVSSVASFTTLAASACTDNYEANETQSAAKLITSNTAITAKIGTSTDVDWFKFTTTTTAKNIQVTLTNLPADYDIALYNSSGKKLTSSVNGGTTNESMKYNGGAAGTYYVKVYGYSSAYNASSCYTLKAATSATAFRLANETATVDEITPLLTSSLYPNPTSGLINLDLIVNKPIEKLSIVVYDILGNEVHSEEATNVDGKFNTTINMMENPSGIYQVVVKAGDYKEVKRVILSH